MPLKKVRQHCSDEFLSKSDSEIQETINYYSTQVHAAYTDILEKYGNLQQTSHPKTTRCLARWVTRTMSSIINRMNNSLKISYLYLLLGVIAFIVGIFVTKNTIEFTQQAINAKGKVSRWLLSILKFIPK